MFLLILIILKLSGRRGVRQLTLFEVAIIINLRSAAGNPMFQEDIPIFHAIVVFIGVIIVYKLITWLASRSKNINGFAKYVCMLVSQIQFLAVI